MADETVVTDSTEKTTDTLVTEVKTDKAVDVKDDKVSTVETPIEYKDFKFPNEVKVDDADLGSFKDVAKELKLTQEQAQKLIDLQASVAQKHAKITQDQWNDVQKDWRTKSETDKEFGGEKFKENIGVAKKALDAFASKEFKEALELTGMGNHPEMIRFLYKVGKTLKEDSVQTTGASKGDPKDLAKILYPNLN